MVWRKLKHRPSHLLLGNLSKTSAFFYLTANSKGIHHAKMGEGLSRVSRNTQSLPIPTKNTYCKNFFLR
uniref:Uncharacterized protein n=1 Tax=Globodera rostochiensis TaxID=31243 RepID=A0A914HWT0_GLORO